MKQMKHIESAIAAYTWAFVVPSLDLRTEQHFEGRRQGRSPSISMPFQGQLLEGQLVRRSARTFSFKSSKIIGKYSVSGDQAL